MDPESPQPATVEYKIVGGTTLEGVAQGLEQAGVIADKSAFLKTAVSKKINYKVRAGTYRFQVGEDFDSIISKISPKASGS
ncbi:YceG-like family protein [compost metagenome]